MDPSRQRDLYRRLLELSTSERLEPLLSEALELLRELAGAERGALELREGLRRWRIGALEGLSSGVVEEVLRKGEAVHSLSALEDQRFSGLASVQGARIEQVHCLPLGQPPRGVLYLQGGPALSEERLALLGDVARWLAPWTRALMREEGQREDPTARWREELGGVELVGRSRAFAELLRQVVGLREFDVHVLITGPTGSGKSELARLLHDTGPRKTGRFVQLNCAALPSELVEAELFGALRGAHSTAHRDRRGLLEEADGGTLFLDEVGELSPAVQAKLLVALESGRFRPLGGTRERKVDLRILAATHRDLDQARASGAFRSDLFYRLERFKLAVPSLEERREDIPELVEVLLRRACREHGMPRIRASPEALQLAREQVWPGQIRELHNRVQRGLVAARMDLSERVEARHLFPEAVREPEARDFHTQTRAFQRRLVRDAVKRAGGNRSQAARDLGITRSHLYKMLGA